MRILWIVNIPFGLHFELIKKEKTSDSGSWYQAAYDVLKESNQIELHIVTLGETDHIISKTDTFGNTFYLLPGQCTRNANNFDSDRNQNLWNEIRKISKPNIVQLWGTEYQHGLCALKQMSNIPKIVYMQGVMSEIAKYYKSGITDKTIWKNQTLRSALLKRDSIFRQQRLYEKMSIVESEILKIAQNVIVENDWCEGICKTIIGSDANIFKSNLPINSVFFKYNWDSRMIEQYTIFTNAGGYPIKGHHHLFLALSLVIKKYPNVKVRIPGNKGIEITRKDWKSRIKQDDYSNYLLKLIKKYNLESNIEWIGHMSQSQIADLLSKSNIYIMPSAIENHSSSLIEAMVVGVPCISSFVGGIGDFAVNNYNCLLYRFDDTRSLAANIIKLIEDKSLCKRLSEGTKDIRRARNHSIIKEEFISIYKSVNDTYNT